MREEASLGVWKDDLMADLPPLPNRLPQVPKESAVCRGCVQERPGLAGHPGVCFGCRKMSELGL